MNSLFSIFIVQKITALQIIHNNRINENGGYQKSLACLSWKPGVSAKVGCNTIGSFMSEQNEIQRNIIFEGTSLQIHQIYVKYL